MNTYLSSYPFYKFNACYLTGKGIDYDYKQPQTPKVYEYTFSAGDTCATPDRPIPIVDDKESDENERFEIHIVDDSIPYGTQISGRDYVSVTIRDNDSKCLINLVGKIWSAYHMKEI